MTTASNDEIRILTPSGMLGYGFPVDHFKMGLAQKPHAITIDSGSTDSGPQKLGLGEMTCSREAYVKDIEVLLAAQHEARIPLLISSAGGDGTNLHVDVFRDIIAEIAKKHKISEQTIYTWKKRFGSFQPDDVRRLKQLEQENARLKKLVAERDLEIEVMKEIAVKKW